MAENDTAHLDQQVKQKEREKVDAEITLNRQKLAFEKRRWKAEYYLKVITLAATVTSSLLYVVLKEVLKVAG